MKAIDYIKTKQIQWAKSNGIPVVGSTIRPGETERVGDKAFTKKRDDNLFEPLIPDVEKNLRSGAGGELNNRNKGTTFPKFQALHSSSAIGINFFQYWKRIGNIVPIVHACGLCSKDNRYTKDIQFEQELKIRKSFSYHPNIDVVIENSDESQFAKYAIECKFSEPYGGRKHSGLKKKYLDSSLNEIWKGIPAIRKLGHKISPNDNKYVHLHAAQLIKHILGLNNAVGKGNYRLLYLWYDAPGLDGCKHRKEIEKFTKYMKADNIKFSHITYQEVIRNLVKHHYKTNEKYLNYLSSRYL